jgi:hypothetical protein
MAGGAPGITEMSAIGRAVEMRRRSDPNDGTGLESSRLGWLEPVSLADASKKRGSAAQGASVVSRDDALPEAVHDLLTDAQLAVRWQLSRGTLANQRSQGRGPVSWLECRTLLAFFTRIRLPSRDLLQPGSPASTSSMPRVRKASTPRRRAATAASRAASASCLVRPNRTIS